MRSYLLIFWALNYARYSGVTSSPAFSFFGYDVVGAFSHLFTFSTLGTVCLTLSYFSYFFSSLTTYYFFSSLTTYYFFSYLTEVYLNSFNKDSMTGSTLEPVALLHEDILGKLLVSYAVYLIFK